VSGSKEPLVVANALPATLSLACLSSEFLQCSVSYVARFESLVILFFFNINSSPQFVEWAAALNLLHSDLQYFMVKEEAASGLRTSKELHL
jgi:hypothetical protein